MVGLSLPERTCSVHEMSPSVRLLTTVVFPSSQGVSAREDFIEAHKHLGYMTREEFIRDATRSRLKTLTDEYEYIEIHKDEYEKLEAAIKEMTLPFHGISDYINSRIETALDKYAEWRQQRENLEKRQRRRG